MLHSQVSPLQNKTRKFTIYYQCRHFTEVHPTDLPRHAARGRLPQGRTCRGRRTARGGCTPGASATCCSWARGARRTPPPPPPSPAPAASPATRWACRLAHPPTPPATMSLARFFAFSTRGREGRNQVVFPREPDVPRTRHSAQDRVRALSFCWVRQFSNQGCCGCVNRRQWQPGSSFSAEMRLRTNGLAHRRQWATSPACPSPSVGEWSLPAGHPAGHRWAALGAAGRRQQGRPPTAREPRRRRRRSRGRGGRRRGRRRGHGRGRRGGRRRQAGDA